MVRLVGGWVDGVTRHHSSLGGWFGWWVDGLMAVWVGHPSPQFIGWMVCLVDEWVDGCVGGSVNEWVGGWMDGEGMMDG